MLKISRWIVLTVVVILLLLSSFWLFQYLATRSKDGISTPEIQKRYPKQTAIEARRLEKSLAECREMFKSAPMEAMTNIGAVIRQYKAYERGIEEFQRILDENPDNKRILASANQYLVGYHIGKGEYSKAIDKSNFIIENYPDSDEAFFSKLNIAYCYEKQSGWDKSEKVYKEIAEGMERDIEKEVKSGKIEDRSKTAWLGIIYERLGKSLFHLYRYEQAKELFEKALEKLKGNEELLGPTAYQSSAEAQFLIGESYANLGNNARAKDAYQKVIKEYSNYPGTKEWIEKAKTRFNALN